MKTRFSVVLALAALMMPAASMLAAQETQQKEVKVTVVTGDDETIACTAAMKLSAEQKAKVEELRAEHRLRTVELRADLAKLGAELKRETRKSEPDMKAVEAVLKKMSAVRERLQMNRIEHGLAMKKFLGDDWRMHMRPERGGEDMMWIEAELEEGFEAGEKDVRVYRFMNRDAARAPKGRHGERKMAVPHAKMNRCCPGGAAAAKHRKDSVSKGCHPARGGRGGASHCCRSVRKVCSGSCAAHKSNWESRMFRPQGKKTDHRCSGACRLDKPSDCRRIIDSGGR